MKTMETRKIKNFPGYIVSEFGDVYSVNYGHTGISKKLKQKPTRCGYFIVGLYKNKKAYWKTVHRLVADAFIPNPENKPQVNHLDGNKKNNKVDNLEWVSASENTKHAFAVLGKKSVWKNKTGKNFPASKIVQQIKDGKIISEFYGTAEAERATGINAGQIWKCCQGKQVETCGYKWKYKAEV